MTNPILATDSYKHSHFLQYPPEAQVISAYAEARVNDFSQDLLFFGLQPYLIDYLGRAITAADIAALEDPPDPRGERRAWRVRDLVLNAAHALVAAERQAVERAHELCGARPPVQLHER